MKTTNYEEQLEYLRSRRKEIFSFKDNGPIGMNLYLVVETGALIEYELRKKFTKVDKSLLEESFIIKEYNEEMDKLCIQPSQDFLLSNSFKNDIRLKVISQFMRQSKNKKLYPSEMRRKEKVLNNKIQRAYAQVDDYFRSGDIHYRTIESVIDMFEVIVNDGGKQVDLHIGNRGFTLGRERTPKDILLYVKDEKRLMKEKEEMVDVFEKEVFNLLDAVSSNLTNPGLQNLLYRTIEDEIEIDVYSLKHDSMDDFTKMLSNCRDGIDLFVQLIQEMDDSNMDVSNTDLRVSLVNCKIYESDTFVFDYKKESVHELMKKYNEYCLYKPFMVKVKEELSKNEVNTKVQYKDGTLQMKARYKIVKEIRTVDELVLMKPQKKKSAQMVFHCKEGKIYRETGEEVLTIEVVLFEIMEKLRNLNSLYLQSVEKAKAMFCSTLTTEEEQLLEERGLTILEGEDNYYALLNSQTYNNVVKIPKVMKHVSEIKSLCIHPADNSVPMYDGLAAIAFALKTGDEQYVLDNSNQFNVSSNVLTKVLDACKTFVPNLRLAI